MERQHCENYTVFRVPPDVLAQTERPDCAQSSYQRAIPEYQSGDKMGPETYRLSMGQAQLHVSSDIIETQFGKSAH